MSVSAANLLAKIDAYLAESGKSATAFGREVLGDPSFVRRLREGASPRLVTADRIIHYLESDRCRQKPPENAT